MFNRPNHLVHLLALVAGAAFVQSAHADDPRVIEQTAKIVNLEDTCGLACAFAAARHSHGGTTLWDLKPGETFEVNHRLFDSKKFFFDLAWNITSEMQDPDPHLVNKDEHPFSTLNFVSENGAVKISDFLFVFTIHDLANPDGKPPSPHAVVYIPFRTTAQANVELGNFYQLYVIHIPDSDDVCAAQPLDASKLICYALRRLAEKWKSGDYSHQGLTKEARLEARKFLDHMFDGLPPLTLPPAGADPIEFLFKQFTTLGIHNGIIHGTLGGG